MEVPLVEFIQSSGICTGRIPRVTSAAEYFISNAGIGFVGDPVDVVRLHISLESPRQRRCHKHAFLGGVSIGYRAEHAVPPTLPDLLVGWIDTTGKWHWGGSQHGEIANLHSWTLPRHPGIPAWPVWFTFANFTGQRTHFIQSRVDVVDIYEAYRDTQRRAFWDAAKQEFIAKTWAPSRLLWCLDVEESSVLLK